MKGELKRTILRYGDPLSTPTRFAAKSSPHSPAGTIHRIGRGAKIAALILTETSF
jgi:hypothetical protein